MSTIPAPAGGEAGRQPERGAAMIFALLGLATLTVLGLGLTSLGMLGTRMTTNERDTQEALALADAGLAHARKLITYQEWDWDTMTPFLVSGDGIACNGDELAQEPTPPPGMPAIPAAYPDAFIPAPEDGGVALGNGSYRVYVCDDHQTDWDAAFTPAQLNAQRDVDRNRRIIVRAVGITASGATATAERVFGSRDMPAVIVNGDVNAGGNLTIGGDGGIIHANGEMDITGNSVCAHQYYSASGDIEGQAEGGVNCDEEGETWPGSAPINIRNVDPANLRSFARYHLRIGIPPAGGANRGLVYRNPNWPAAATDAQLVLEATVQDNQSWGDWRVSFGDYEWRTTGDGIPRGTYYAQTNISVGGSLDASCAAGDQVTILSSGWVNIAGGAKLCGYLERPGLNRITVVAGTDLEMNGNGGNTPADCVDYAYQGLYYARHQIKVGGNANICGQLVALNLADTDWPVAPIPGVVGNPDNLVEMPNDGFMDLTGSATVTYSGGGIGALSPRTWRECRKDPANEDPVMPDDACGLLYGES